MANRSKIMGLHGLKNKPRRNAFDLSHRNLFTAKVGELLPCAVFELNPGDTIKLETSYFTRTAPLQSAAFTRLRENVQFFFVPYSQLWKYFETQVLNMTKTAAGGDVSRIASDITTNQAVTTQMPYVNYKSLHKYLSNCLMLPRSQSSPDTGVWLNNGEYRWSASAKLLQMLGYGNFTYYMNAEKADSAPYDEGKFTNFPNLSVFRLLAYQKICNDHYTYRQWQPYNASLCNVDYMVPSSSSALDLSSKLEGIKEDGWNSLNFTDLRFSNLPLDYFNGVLPTAQYGSESVVSLGLDTKRQVDSFAANKIHITTPYVTAAHTMTGIGQNVQGGTKGSSYTSLYFDEGSSSANGIDELSGYLNYDGSGLSVYNAVTSDGSDVGLSITALRNAVAMQRYKEIQLANDVDFVSQIEAHFGIKPKCSDTVSRFIGGASSMIDINPQVNTNLSDENQATLKAAPTGNGKASMKFTADTYGVVIGIYRCTPVLDYAHLGIDRTLFKTDASDFVIPELDSVGMQQTYISELYSPTLTANDPGAFDLSATYGYAPRFSEYKTSFDRFNGDFCLTMSDWVTGLDSETINNLITYYDLKDYTPELFNCKPSLVSSVFLNQSVKKVSDDNLYVGLVNIAYATRNLSMYGLPYSK